MNKLERKVEFYVPKFNANTGFSRCLFPGRYYYYLPFEKEVKPENWIKEKLTIEDDFKYISELIRNNRIVVKYGLDENDFEELHFTKEKSKSKHFNYTFVRKDTNFFNYKPVFIYCQTNEPESNYYIKTSNNKLLFKGQILFKHRLLEILASNNCPCKVNRTIPEIKNRNDLYDWFNKWFLEDKKNKK